MTRQKTNFSEIYPRCYRILIPTVWIMFMIFVIMCIVFDLYYCLEHKHLAGMIWLYTCGTLCMILVCTINCIPYAPPSENSVYDYPKVVWFYIIWFIVCFIAKIVTIIIFILNEQGKINIGLDPDSFIISVINWLVSSSPGTAPVAFAMVAFTISCPFVICGLICESYAPNQCQDEQTKTYQQDMDQLVHNLNRIGENERSLGYDSSQLGSNYNIVFLQLDSDNDSISVRSVKSTDKFKVTEI
jgi:hypothetical protein